MTSHCAVFSGAEQKHVYFFLVSCLKNVSLFGSLHSTTVGQRGQKSARDSINLSGLLPNEVLRASGKWICFNDPDFPCSLIVILSRECSCQPRASVLAKTWSYTMKKSMIISTRKYDTAVRPGLSSAYEEGLFEVATSLAIQWIVSGSKRTPE